MSDGTGQNKVIYQRSVKIKTSKTQYHAHSQQYRGIPCNTSRIPQKNLDDLAWPENNWRILQYSSGILPDTSRFLRDHTTIPPKVPKLISFKVKYHKK